MAKINLQTLMEATGSNESDARRFLPYINSSISKYSINTPERVLAFLSQIGHESAHLRTTTEYGSGQQYEGRADLGNTHVGDGVKYKGRGLIQITGRSNYADVSQALGEDFINNPQLLAQPKYAAEASAWWWKNKGLNEIADTMDIRKPLTDPNNQQAFVKITSRIQGCSPSTCLSSATTNYTSRKSNWEKGKDAVIRFVKGNPIATALGVLTFGLLATTIAYYFLNKEKIKLVTDTSLRGALAMA